MASIYVSSVTTTSVTMYIKDLDTNWSQGTRYTYWTITSGRTSTSKSGNSISNYASLGGNVTFSGLTAGTTYSVTCVITYSSSELPDDDDTQTLATLTSSFTTESVTTTDPTITSVNYSANGLTVTFVIDINNPSAVSYDIEVYDPDSGELYGSYSNTTSSVLSFQYTFDSAGTYNIRVNLYASDSSVQYDRVATTVTVSGSSSSNNPSITDISYTTSGLTATFTVTISNPSSVKYKLIFYAEEDMATDSQSGTSTTVTFSYTYDSAGTYSAVFWLVDYSNGTSYDLESTSVTLKSASIEITSVDEDSVTMQLVDLDTSWSQGVRYPHWYIRKGSSVTVNSSTHDPTSSGYDSYSQGANIANGASSGGSVTFEDLDSSSTYYVYCVVKYSKSGTATYVASFTSSFTTSASTKPSITSVSYTNSALTVTFSIKVYNPYGKTYYVSIYNGSTRLVYGGSWSTTGTATRTLTYTFANYNTAYGLTVYISYGSTSSTVYDKETLTVTISATRKYFSWTSDTLLTSKPSNDAPISSGDKISTYLTATRWNNLEEIINDLRELKGYSDYSFTTAVAGNTLTAAMFNQCVYAITAINGATASSYIVSTGDIVTAAKLNGFQSAVNAITI